MKKLLGVLIEIAVIFLVGFICGAIWISKYAPSWVPDWLSPQGISYSALTVHTDTFGHFDGTVRLSNHERLHVAVLVTVHLYKGDQAVGDLNGSVTLKPESSSAVDLSSVDDFTSYDNTTIELLPIPANTAS